MQPFQNDTAQAMMQYQINQQQQQLQIQHLQKQVQEQQLIISQQNSIT